MQPVMTESKKNKKPKKTNTKTEAVKQNLQTNMLRARWHCGKFCKHARN